jgi:general secretion pathway protein I
VSVVSESLDPRREAGFTLVELMVALAVFSLVALTLLKLQGTVVRNSGEIAARATGQIVAHNLAVEIMTDPRAPSLGTESWRWVRQTKATADPTLVRVDIAVANALGQPAAALTLARPVE